MAIKNWFVGVSFKTELLSEYAIQHGYITHMASLLDIDFYIKNRMNVDNDICAVKEEYEAFKNYICKDYLRLIPKFFRDIEKVSKSFIRFGSQIPGNIDKYPKTKLTDLFKGYYQHYEQSAGLIAMPLVCELSLIDILKKKIEKYIDKDSPEFDNFLSLIAFSKRNSSVYTEKIDLINIAIKIHKNPRLRKIFLKNNIQSLESIIKKDKVISSMIDNHIKKYIWIYKTLFLGDDYSFSTALESIKRLIHENPNKVLNKLKENKKRQIKNFNMVKKKLKLKSDIIKDIKLFQELIYFRDVRLEWLNRGCQYGVGLLKEIAKRLSLTFEQIIYLFPEEIMAMLEGKMRVNKQEIGDRLKKYALVMEDEKITLYTGDKVDQFKVKEEVQETDIIKGFPASKGKAKRKVRIVKDRTELYKVKKGDILVTRLTTPDFVIAMEKAGAIVTDIGGLTSHAAVVSREMKKPCIIGTKIATKVLKDGDLVEVDANKGVVKILKRK